MPAVPGTRRRASHQLPPGRHGLSPSFVASNQRQRIMAALADAVKARGYPDVTVEDVIARAGVSRRTFYDQFGNKQEAFLAAYDEVTSQLMDNIMVALRSGTTFEESVERSLEAFLYYLAVEPAFAHMCIVDALAAGPAAIERRNGIIRTFHDLFERAAETLGERPPPLTSETVVNAIHGVVYSRIAEDRCDELPGLLPDLLYSSLLPYLGQRTAKRARAAAERRLADA
jgi:AcrR family transcriptional regulator